MFQKVIFFFQSLFSSSKGSEKNARNLCQNLNFDLIDDITFKNIFSDFSDLHTKNVLQKIEWEYSMKLIKMLEAKFGEGKMHPWFAYFINLNDSIGWGNSPKFELFLFKLFRIKMLLSSIVKKLNEKMNPLSESIKAKLEEYKKSLIDKFVGKKTEFKKDFESEYTFANESHLDYDYSDIIYEFNRIFEFENEKINNSVTNINEYYSSNIKLLFHKIAEKITDIILHSKFNKKVVYITRDKKINFKMVYNILIVLQKVPNFLRFGRTYSYDIFDQVPQDIKSILI